METCVRGFSFMPETKVEGVGLQYIESGELERTWKTSRRQRLKEQEQKVWEEFVKEQDVVKVVSKDDPYQFLHELPEACLKELMEAELQKARKEVELEKKTEQPSQGEGDFHQRDEIQHAVTFADDGEDCDMFHIFDDEKDEPSGPSGPEDEVLDSMSSPCTVRGRDSENNSPPPVYEKGDNKSVEDVTNVIESSIYCAKVKDLRIKIHEEILAIMATLEQQDVMTIEREEVSRVCRRSAEFSARFNRIYMYQLQRQVQELERGARPAPARALHTHFLALMLRVASLHHNLLQAFQVFHRAVPHTACVRESAAALHALAAAARAASAAAAAVRAPPRLRAAALLYTDEMLASCDKLDEAVCEHSLRVADFLSTADNTSRSTSRNTKGKGKKRMLGPLSKTTKSMTDTEGRLSMYSLDTLRLNLNGKENQSSGYSKMRGPLSSIASKAQAKNEAQPKSPKRSPRLRRARMRARAGAGGGCARQCADADVCTMVQAVDPCTSSRMSREPSARRRPAAGTPRAPRVIDNATARKSLTNTPRGKFRTLSPKAKVRRGSPKQSQIIKALSIIRSEAQNSEGSHIQVTPVSKIKCAKKDMSVGKNFDKSLEAKDLDKIYKLDKNIVKNSVQDSSKDFDSNGICGSKAFRSVKDFDSFNDFDSGKDFESRKDFDGGKETATSSRESKEPPRKVTNTPINSAREERDGSRSEREMNKCSRAAPARCEVTRLLKQLCSGDAAGSRNEKVSGAKNAQLLCVTGGSPRQPTTPQLLRILEETIQKKAPKPMYPKPTIKDPERFRMTFNIPDKTADRLLQYRTGFVQHMLASALYANSAVGKPWEMIGSVSEKIIDELLMGCAKEMQLKDVLQELYNCETK